MLRTGPNAPSVDTGTVADSTKLRTAHESSGQSPSYREKERGGERWREVERGGARWREVERGGEIRREEWKEEEKVERKEERRRREQSSQTGAEEGRYH